MDNSKEVMDKNLSNGIDEIYNSILQLAQRRNTDNSIKGLQEKINGIIDEMLDNLIKRLERRDREFEGKIDTFPFFCLLINLKKSFYESLFSAWEKNGDLENLMQADEEWKEMFLTFCNTWNISRSPLSYPSLKSFKKKAVENPKKNYLIIDTIELFKYLNDFEDLLSECTVATFLFELHENLTAYGPSVYADKELKYNKNENCNKNVFAKEHGVPIFPPRSLDEVEYFDFFERDMFSPIDNTHLWYTECLEDHEKEEDTEEHEGFNWKYSGGVLENNFVFGLKKHIIKSTNKHRFSMLLKEEKERGSIKLFLQNFINIYSSYEAIIPEGVLLSTLQNTYINMFYVIRANRLNTLCEYKGLKKTDLAKLVAIPKASHKIGNDFNYYVETEMLTHDQIDLIIKALGFGPELHGVLEREE